MGEEVGLADLHIHTIYSPDGTGTVRAVLKRAAEVGLDVLAITDHDEIRAALEGIDLAPSYGVQVIPGSEVSTADGHLLALFVHRSPPAGLSLSDTVRWVRDHGGVCIVPHPGGRERQNLKRHTICQVLNTSETVSCLVGIEVFNASIVHLKRNHLATEMAHGLPLAAVSNSDAHLVRMIGSAATYFPGRTAQELHEALIRQITQVAVAQPASRPGFFLQWGVHLALRYTGWVTGNRHPDAPIRKTCVWISAPQTF